MMAGDFSSSASNDFQWRLIDVKFRHARARRERAHVRHEVAKSEGRVNVFCIQRGENDVWHQQPQ